MKTKIIKALAKINILLDEKQQKLSDKYHDLELSHKRKYNLLKNIEQKLNILTKEEEHTHFGFSLIHDLLFKINQELTFFGRVRY